MARIPPRTKPTRPPVRAGSEPDRPVRLDSRRRSAASLAAAAAVLASARPALADTGLPMLIVAWPGAIVLAPAVIAVEAIVARAILGASFGRSIALSAAANAVSAILGVPIAWLVFFVPALALAMLHPALYVAFWPFWLPPFVDFGPSAVLLAAAILCAPFFVVSYAIEWRVALMVAPEIEEKRLRRFSFRANLASYALLAAALVISAAISR